MAARSTYPVDRESDGIVRGDPLTIFVPIRVVHNVTTVSASATVSCTDATFTTADNGMAVSGTGIPSGATFSYVSATSGTLSAAATASGDVEMSTKRDLSAWTWAAQIRRGGRDGTVLFSFSTSVSTDLSGVALSLTATQTALLKDGDCFDLAEVTPTVRTWWIVSAIRMEKDVSHA